MATWVVDWIISCQLPVWLYFSNQKQGESIVAMKEKINPARVMKVMDLLGQTIAAAKARQADHEASLVYQFPLWPDPQRGFPNEVIRSALFAAIQPKKVTSYLTDVNICCQDGYRIRFTGRRLDQTHLDVFEGIMHIARGMPENSQIRFSAYKLLRLIGRSTGSSDHEWLFRTIQQLTASSVVVVNRGGEEVFWGSLLPSGTANLKKGGYCVDLPRHLVKLFERGFTSVDFERRKLLRRKPLCQWLHLYYSSHAKPYPVKVETLRDLSGSGSTVRRFKANLKIALTVLKEFQFIKDWKIERDLVYVDNQPTPSQLRYLKNSP